MKRISTIVMWSIIGLVLLGFSGAKAQTPAIASAPIRVDSSGVNNLWFQALDYLEARQWLETNLKLLDLNYAKYQSGLTNLYNHSRILIQKARQLQEQGNREEAMKLLESARILSPDSAEVYFARAGSLFKQDFTNFYGVGRELWRGLRLKYSDLFTIITYANNSLSLFLFAGGVASLVFVLFSFIYYRRAIFYQFKAIFPFEVPALVGHIIGWILLAVVALGLGIFWAILLLAFLLLWHIDLHSKRVLRVIFFFGGILAGLLLLVSMTFSTFQGEYFQALRDIARGRYTSRTVTVLQNHLQTHPGDAYALFGLAYIAQKTDNIQLAIEAYEQIPPDSPLQAAVQNNLGNIYQQQYRNTRQQAWLQKAEQAYRKAVYSAPQMFEVRYNFGKFLLLEFQNSEQADAELQQARELDRYRFTMYSESLRDSVDTIDIPFTTVMLLKKLYEPGFFATATTLAEQVWTSGSRLKNVWYFSIVSGVLFILTFVFGAKKGALKYGIIYCQMCGDPYLIKQKKKQEPQTFCTQCTYIFKKKTVVKPEKREAKVKQIQLRQKSRGFLAKIFSLGFPGAGQIYYGYSMKGVLLAFLFSLAAGMFLLKGFFRILVDAEIDPGLSWGTIGIFLLLLLFSYLFNIYDILKLSPRNQ